MHEMGAVLNIVATAKRLAQRYGVQKLGYVKIEVGELSDALPKYLKELWPMGAKGTVCEGAELIIEETAAVARCAECGKEYPVMENLQADDLPMCPYCHHRHYSIIAGDGITMVELGVPDE